MDRDRMLGYLNDRPGSVEDHPSWELAVAKLPRRDRDALRAG